ncbi:MAG: hypothetical protein IJF08_06930 [Clostridia bacterium]|nr:hypothetical protein [Clostridia bacterium]
MINWIKRLFKPPVDKTELKIKELFQFLLDDYGLSYIKTDLGDLVDKNGKIIFYGPLNVYQIYNDNLCINIVNLVQRGDYDIYITEIASDDQHYIFDGMHLPSNLAYNLPLFASQVKSELLNGKTIFGKSI